jgi:hypothetical protein
MMALLFYLIIFYCFNAISISSNSTCIKVLFSCPARHYGLRLIPSCF